MRRLLAALPLLAAASLWAFHWANRFFESRRAAEADMDRLQRLMKRGFFDPAIDARVTAALEESHKALLLAFGGPVLLAIAYFFGVWIWMAIGARGLRTLDFRGVPK